MKKTSSILRKGFTLVEILIVIAIIGILATALLIALDPIEQFNKANDSGLQSAAKQLSDALNRYYATRQSVPWAAAPAANCYGGTTVLNTTNSSELLNVAVWGGTTTGGACFQQLVSAGEIKQSFINGLSTNQRGALLIRQNGTTTNSDIQICYRPSSKANIANTNITNQIRNTNTPFGLSTAAMPATQCTVAAPCWACVN